MGNHFSGQSAVQWFRLTCLALVLSVSTVSATGAVPLLINYQGEIAGTDSLVVITFAFHEDQTGSTPLWSETHEVSVIGSRFSVLLGSITPIDADLFDASDRYLALTVDGEALAPRQQIVSVAYALRSAHASNVAGEAITPRSVTIQGAGGSWDTSGVVAPIVATDSLVVGSTPVIDGGGNWVGPAISTPSAALELKSITNVQVDTTEVFFFNSKWLPFARFDTFITVPSAGKLDISFVGRISCKNPFRTRLTLKQTTPSSTFLGKIGNTSGAHLADSEAGATVHNQAIVDVAAGTYRVFVEHISQSVIEATLRSGSLIIRYYE